MRILDIRTLPGPNVHYSSRPVLQMHLDLEELAGKESYEIAGFIERLMDALPGIREHHCGLGRPGGFVERLHSGTYFGHIVEHVALELTDAAGIPVNHGKTRETSQAGVYSVVVTYRNEAGMRSLLQTAVEFVQALVDDRPFPLEERIAEARDLVRKTELGPSTRALVHAAEMQGIPWRRLNDRSLVQLGYGKHRKFVEAAMTSNSSAVAVDIAGDKELTKRLLSNARIPVPLGCVVRSRDEAAAALEGLRTPLVVKPLDGSQGRGVLLGLRTEEDVRRAYEFASEHSYACVVEEQLEGRDYRVLVVDGRMVAAAERTPANVNGDGIHTIAELIEIANRDPRRGEEHEKQLTRIKPDMAMLHRLERLGLTLDSVPEQGELILLLETANLSKGGEARDVTDCVHPSIARMCERAARIIGLDICGIDLIAEDISQPLNLTGGIVEVNAAPGLRMHLFPSEGEPRDVASPVIASMYRNGSNGRIPIVAITGTNGKTTVTRLTAHILGAAGQCVGMTTTDGIYIGGQCVAQGDMTGPASAHTVLSDPCVDAAVLETARGGMVRRGLGYDWSDVGVITNIQPDHIGQDGIESVDDILRIKRLVALRVREGGSIVLNCDDPRLAAMAGEDDMRERNVRVVLFSLNADAPPLRWHMAQGHTGFFVDNGWLIEGAGPARWRIAPVADIPITLGGAADFQVANVLAAVAAARALQVGAREIRAALMSFDSVAHNAGRLNIYRAGDAYFLLDYGHNAPALEAVCRTAEHWKGRRVTAILGLPGDRNDELIRSAARTAAAGFDRLIIREDRDLRGRRPGETGQLIASAALSAQPSLACIHAQDELDAVRLALGTAIPGEIIIAFCEDLDGVISALAEHGAEPVRALPPVHQPEARAV